MERRAAAAQYIDPSSCRHAYSLFVARLRGEVSPDREAREMLPGVQAEPLSGMNLHSSRTRGTAESLCGMNQRVSVA